MREKKNTTKNPRQLRTLTACLLFSLILTYEAQAESLYRATANYQEKAPIGARSLFAPPIAREVGDVVTILIDERAQTSDTAELKITRAQEITGDSAGTVNRMIRFFTDKLPIINSTKLANMLSVPSMAGIDNENTFNSKAEAKRDHVLRDNVACQVMQVLPNGDLVIQGQKTIQMNKEREDMVVTGIVRPFYLDRNNQISSRMVGNFQLIKSGKGVISRQQNDGMANKIHQFFN